MSAEAMQRMEWQQGPMTCSAWCLLSSSSSRWPPLVPIQRVAALCTIRAFTLAQGGAASVGSSTSLPCRPLQPERCLREEEIQLQSYKHLNLQKCQILGGCVGDHLLFMIFLLWFSVDDIHNSPHGAHSLLSLFTHNKYFYDVNYLNVTHHFLCVMIIWCLLSFQETLEMTKHN